MGRSRTPAPGGFLSRFPCALLALAAVFPAAWAGEEQGATGQHQPPPALSASTPASNRQPATRPSWRELTPAQQQALAPLASEWDRLDAFRKNKWLAIGNKFAGMTPDEQQRIQERMREWVGLTPEQRRIARESYARSKKLNSDQKSARWEKYQQLPDEQKKKLAADAASKKPIARLPSAASQSKNSPTVPPIKSVAKPVPERSVTPQPAKISATQPPSQPATN